MRSWLPITLAALALFVSACGRQPSPIATERQTVSLAVVGALDEDPAASVLRGVQIAISEYNSSSGSTFEARLLRIAVDGTPESIDQAGQKIVAAERVIGTISGLNEGDAVKIGSVAEENSIPFMVPNLQALAITTPDRTTFRRLIANDRQEGAALLSEAANRSAGPAFLVHTQDASGIAFNEGAKAHLEKIKRPIVKIESVATRPDFKALSSSAVQSGAQLVGFGGDGEIGRNFALALAKGGYKGIAVFSHQIMAMKGSGGDVPTTFLASSPTPDKADPAISEFRSTHRQRFSTDPRPFTIESYEAALMLLEAIEEVEARPKEITEFLRLNRSFLGDSKEYSFDESGELLDPPVWVYQAKGEWRYIGRSDRVKRR